MDSNPEQTSSPTAEQIRNQARDNLLSSLVDFKLVANFRDYLEAEVNLAKSKSRAAFPRFNLEADKAEQHFNSALNFLKTDGKVGRDAVEDVLLKICDEELERTRKIRESRQGVGGREQYAQHLREVVLNNQLRTEALNHLPSNPSEKAA